MCARLLYESGERPSQATGGRGQEADVHIIFSDYVRYVRYAVPHRVSIPCTVVLISVRELAPKGAHISRAQLSNGF